MIEQSIKRYDTNLYVPGHSHADRMIVIKILSCAYFPVEVWYRTIDSYIWTIYDGNHRLRTISKEGYANLFDGRVNY